MKKMMLLVVGLLLISGCGSKEEEKKNTILGTWETKYELSALGEVTESYTFKENGECVRLLNAGSDIADTCTYEIKEDQIRIIWEDKLDKDSYSQYIEVDEDTVMIGEYKYTRKK